MRYFLSILICGVLLSVPALAQKHQKAKSQQAKKQQAQQEQEEQQNLQEQTAGPASDEVERLEVIGSHIKRTNIEGPSPVLVIDREQIEMSGYNSVSDVLRDLPTSSFGGQKEVALNYPSSKSGTSLRGLDGSNILVLMNYKRMPPTGGGNSVDLNIIPISVIERIEILKDGASALYGSDAVGGVINIITKTGDVGGQINVQGSLTQREEGNTLSGLASLADFWNWNAEDENNSWNGKGDKLSIDASYGGSKNDINYLVGGQVRLNTSMYLKDRKYSQIQLKNFSVYSSPGSWANGEKYEPFSECPSERVYQEGDNGSRCKWDYTPYMQSIPRMLQTGVFAHANTEINTDLRASVTGVYSYNSTLSALAPPPLVGWKVPAEVARGWGLQVQGNEDVEMFYRPVNEPGAGQRKTNLNNHSYQLQGSISQDLLNTMELEGNINLSGSHYFSTTQGLIRQNKLLELTKQNKFNPTLPEDKKNNISTANHEVSKETNSNLFSFEPKLSGEVGAIANQPLFFAIGGLGAYQRYLEDIDETTKKIIDKGDKILGGDVTVSGEGTRWFGGLYGELSLLSFEMLELQLAGRTDYYYYSDSETASGFTEQILPFTEDVTMPVSPRVALSFQPMDQIKFRASWGMGFKAPSLESLYQGELVTHPSSVDYVKCPEIKYEENGNTTPECTPAQHKVTATGNINLEPETFNSINLGFVLQPVEQIALSFDYFITKRKNLITTANALNTRNWIKYEAKKGANTLKEKTGVEITRNTANDIEEIKAKNVNTAFDSRQGFDLEASITPISINEGWNLGITLEHSHLIYGEYQFLADADIEVFVPYYEWIEDLFGLDNADPKRKTRKTWPGMPRYRNRAVFSLMNKDKGTTVQLIFHHIPGQLTIPESNKETDHYWQLDLAGKFILNKNTFLTAGIQNVLGFDRPQNPDSSGPAGYLDEFLYSIRGRTLNARLTYNFQ